MSAKILIADDHSLIRLATAQLIRLEGDMECVAQCETVEAAREVLLAQPIDVAVFDLQFNSGNVLDLISEMLTKTNTRYLVSSAHRPELFAPLCRLKGAHGFIHKSAQPERFIECLKEVLAGTSPFVHGFKESSQNHTGPDLSRLSNREWQVLLEIGYGKSTKEIAKRLFLSDKTIESHRLAIKRKLGVTSKDQLAAIASEVSSVLGDVSV